MSSIKKITPEDWAQISTQAHRVVFNTEKPPRWDRISFTLAVESEGDLHGYVTCREITSDWLSWQYGGAFPNTRGTAGVISDFRLLIDWVRTRYKYLSFFVENTNWAMLKIALHQGFKIIGVRTVHNSIMVEHALEFE